MYHDPNNPECGWNYPGPQVKGSQCACEHTESKIETVFELHDDPSVKEKVSVMHKYEAAFDDERNFTDDFLNKLEDMMEFGAKYKIIVEKLT